MNPLSLDSINVVVAGSGGIATALVSRLLQHYPIDHLCWLSRSQPKLEDPRVNWLQIDATDPQSVSAACEQIAQDVDQLHLVVNTIGVLHKGDIQPEKRLKDVSQESLAEVMNVNAFFLPLLAQGLSSLLRHEQPALLASLSARVGSISDNSLGGWYSYRASKAAHNMLLKTLAREWSISHKRVTVLALHPGTVATELSQPFTPPNYRKPVLSPEQCAEALFEVMSSKQPADSGRFFAWDGAEITW